jgi:hypothetical protein
MKRFLNALTLATAALAGASALRAATLRSAPVEIPFTFTIGGKQLPAGTYRLQRGTTDNFATLVNLYTGAQVQLLRPVGKTGEKTKLIFERHGDGYVLRKLS